MRKLNLSLDGVLSSSSGSCTQQDASSMIVSHFPDELRGSAAPSKIPICTKLPFSHDLYLSKIHHEEEKMFNCMTYMRYIFTGYLCTCLI